MNLTISTNWISNVSFPKKMWVFQDLHKDHTTVCQINKKPSLSFLSPPNLNIKLRIFAKSEGKTNSHPNHLNTWYLTWPKKGQLTKRWLTNSTNSLQKTQEIPSWSTIILLENRFCCRNPILKQLPRENNHLERRPRFPHPKKKWHNFF